MKRMMTLIVLAAFLSWAGSAFAVSCPVGQRLRKIGSIQTASANIATNGHEVKLIVVRCGSSACNVGFMNKTSLGGDVTADYVIEIGAAANTTATLDLGDGSLSFGTGVTLVNGDAAMSAGGVYECVPQ